METRRFALLAVLAVIVFFMYQTWQQDYGPGAPPAAGQKSASGTTLSAASSVATTAAGSALQAPVAAQIPGPARGSSGKTTTPAPGTRYVSVRTGTMGVHIGLRGGGIRRLVLEKYPVRKGAHSRKLVFINGTTARSSEPFLVFRQGIAGIRKPLANAQTLYHSARNHYVMAPKQKVLDVPLTYPSPSG